ncbi:MAG TPA: hypothetical protein VLS91_06890 [Acidimicrobiales bacterium]|nr:hypothetical protein [Acidimicrobiales bacterium]
MRLTTIISALVVSSGLVVPASMAAASTSHSSLGQARSELLRLSDLPPGWTTSPANTSSNKAGDSQIAKCLGVPTSFITYNPPQVNSPEFDQRSTGLSVNDSIAIFPNAKILAAQYRLFASAKTVACFSQVFNSPALKSALARQIGPGATVGHMVISRAPRPPGRDPGAAVQIVIPVTANGTSLTITMQEVIIVSGLRAVTLNLVSALGLPFPASLSSHLEAVSAQRLR